jgi:DNA-binding response OmpR family regulator
MNKYVAILLVEDDENLGFVTKDALEERGYHVTWAKDGQEGLELFLAGKFDLCILDVMLPKKDGFQLARDIKHANSVVPIFFLTAKTLQEDKLQGLSIGADQYITKPFDMDELYLRIENILKRTLFLETVPDTDVFEIGKFVFDSKNMVLKFGDHIQNLTKKEGDLLRLLALTPNEILEREMALRIVWGNDDYFLGRSMDVFITKLRKYLKSDPSVSIENIHGIGFKLIIPIKEIAL